jgi:hypothetical protein
MGVRFLAPTAVALMFLSTPVVNSQEHLAPSSLVAERLEGAARERDGRKQHLAALLASPSGARAADMLGTTVPVVTEGLSQLSDAQLADLSARAARLQGDPVAGLSHEANEFLVIFLIVAIVILVIKAVD